LERSDGKGTASCPQQAQKEALLEMCSQAGWSEATE
jgi:hypothetical protein